MDFPPNKIFLINKDYRYSLKVYLAISLAMFFFILFFQPFDLHKLDFNNLLLFIAGLGTIVFLILCLFNIILPWYFPEILSGMKHEGISILLVNILTCVIISLAYVFYLRYVGQVMLSMFIVFKIFLVCVTPIAILMIIAENKSIKHQLYLLREKNIELGLLMEEDTKQQSEIIQFISDNKSENISISASELLLIKSAENYVEIVCKEEENSKRRLIRTTLKSIEEQLKGYPQFTRCHRTCIVNTRYVLELTKNYQGYKLKVHNYYEEVPVSRQYLLNVREALGTL